MDLVVGPIVVAAVAVGYLAVESVTSCVWILIYK